MEGYFTIQSIAHLYNLTIDFCVSVINAVIPHDRIVVSDPTHVYIPNEFLPQIIHIFNTNEFPIADMHDIPLINFETDIESDEEDDEPPHKITKNHF